MNPEPVDALAAYFGILQFPQFPHASVCHAFNDNCASFIALVPTLKQDCSAKIPGTPIDLFPSHEQVVAQIIGVDIVTHPNYMKETTAEFTTACPYASIVPSDLSHPDRMMIIPGSGCAIACPFPMYTAKEFSDHATFWVGSIIVPSFLFLLISLFNLYLIAPAKRNIYIVSYVVIYFLDKVIGSIINIRAMSQPAVGHFLSFEVETCDSNASWRTIHNDEGFSFFHFPPPFIRYQNNCFPLNRRNLWFRSNL